MRRAAVGLLLVSLGCQARGGIRVEKQSIIEVTREPRVVARNLSNPMAPVSLGNGEVAVSRSGRGDIVAVSTASGRVRSLITGFGRDNFGGYDISAQGFAIDSVSGKWIVCAAEGPGQVRRFDPRTFPTSFERGEAIEIRGATDDNPYAAVIAGRRILVVSGGTKKSYTTRLDAVQPQPLEAFLEVASGLIGLTVDPRSGDVFGAVFGSGPGGGSIIRWNADAGASSVKTVARGFTNPVAVAFTPDGTLLAADFGDFQREGRATVWIVATDGSSARIPFLTGLDHTTGLTTTPTGSLFITDFGAKPNGGAGTLIEVGIAPRQGGYR